MKELLKMYLRGKFVYKHNSEIKEMVDRKTNSWITEEEYTDIIGYMYNKEDVQILI